jgi:hypothetical protein
MGMSARQAARHSKVPLRRMEILHTIFRRRRRAQFDTKGHRRIENGFDPYDEKSFMKKRMQTLDGPCHINFIHHAQFLFAIPVADTRTLKSLKVNAL